jgi:hypothetical protein
MVCWQLPTDHHYERSARKGFKARGTLAHNCMSVPQENFDFAGLGDEAKFNGYTKDGEGRWQP